MDLNVLLISNGFQPNYEKAFANGLAENGVAVELVGSDRTLVNGLRHGVHAINLRGSQDPSRSRLKKVANLLRYVAALAQHIRRSRPAVVHLTGLFMTPSVAAGLLECIGLRVLSCRLFMTVHNLLPHDRHTHLNHMMYWVIYRLPHKLVVHTLGMKNSLIEQFGIRADRIVVMHHGVDDVPDAAPQSYLARNTLHVLLFGVLSPYKGADLLLQALQHCPDMPVHMVIAGECAQPDYANEIARLIETTGKPHRVVWDRGFVPEDKVRGYFESADVVVLPYRHIDQSGVLFTAFRFGTPVIATDVGAFRECLPAFAGLICPQPTPVEIAKCLAAFEARRHEFKRGPIRQHAQTLLWSQTVHPLINAYGGRA